MWVSLLSFLTAVWKRVWGGTQRKFLLILECVQGARKQPEPLKRKVGGQALRPLEEPVPVLLQLCAVPLWVQDVSLPQRELLPLKHEAGVVCIECQDRATITGKFLIARFENPPHIIFCMLQDYLVVAVGSLTWFGDAVFPGCSRHTGCWKTHKSLSAQGQKWSPVVLQLCKLQDLLHSPFVPPVVSNIAASWSVTVLICLLHPQDIFLFGGVCVVCYLQTLTQLQNMGFQLEQQVQKVVWNGSPLVRVSL